MGEQCERERVVCREIGFLSKPGAGKGDVVKYVLYEYDRLHLPW